MRVAKCIFLLFRFHLVIEYLLPVVKIMKHKNKAMVFHCGLPNILKSINDCVDEKQMYYSS